MLSEQILWSNAVADTLVYLEQLLEALQLYFCNDLSKWLERSTLIFGRLNGCIYRTALTRVPPLSACHKPIQAPPHQWPCVSLHSNYRDPSCKGQTSTFLRPILIVLLYTMPALPTQCPSACSCVLGNLCLHKTCNELISVLPKEGIFKSFYAATLQEEDLGYNS